jgi:hypothetical protein
MSSKSFTYRLTAVFTVAIDNRLPLREDITVRDDWHNWHKSRAWFGRLSPKQSAESAFRGWRFGVRSSALRVMRASQCFVQRC